MASVDWKKVKTPTEVKAIFRHNDKEMRSQSNVVHTNEHINKNETWKNTSILGLSYDELCKKYDERISYLDSHGNTNKRKDRVTCINLELPVPEKLNEKDYDNWFIDVAEIFRTRYGIDNLLEGIIHKDEIHEYYDSSDGKYKMSRVHGHFSIIPELDGKLNAKKIETKREMNMLNNAINKMSIEKYKVKFMTGEKNRSKGSVEDCKRMSNEEERKHIKNAKKALSAQMEKLQERKTELSSKENELNTLTAKANRSAKDIVSKANVEAERVRREAKKTQEEATLRMRVATLNSSMICQMAKLNADTNRLEKEKLRSEYEYFLEMQDKFKKYAQNYIATIKDEQLRATRKAELDKQLSSFGGDNESLDDYVARITRKSTHKECSL